MLGHDLVEHLRGRHEVIGLERAEADITDPLQVNVALQMRHPEIVIHSAAFTAVDECERQPEHVFQVNGEGTKNLALACRKDQIPLLYVSTDYVFDGEKPEPYMEDDPPNPINVYGRSKLLGERYVLKLLDRFWIVRTSWLFGMNGKNFVRTILTKAATEEPFHVVDDQIGSPTFTADLAMTLGQIVEKGSPGVYHATNQGACSWFEFAREILRQAGFNPSQISSISSQNLNRPARRPKNSRLANARIQSVGLPLLPAWQDALHRYLIQEGVVPANNSPKI
jgi:dTDP-4-dehydrorhamnose reductase